MASSIAAIGRSAKRESKRVPQAARVLVIPGTVAWSRPSTQLRVHPNVQVYPVAAAVDVADAFSAAFISARPGASAEAIAFEHAGYGFYTVPEGSAARLHYVPSE